LNEITRQSWVEAEPDVLKRERAAMTELAPSMEWREDLRLFRRPAVGWRGYAPDWGGKRAKPDGVDELLDGRRLELEVRYPEAFPIVPPSLAPLGLDIPPEAHGLTQWHVLPDGSLCLVRDADDWQPNETAAELVCKASGWFIEFLLMQGGHIERMTERGILIDTQLDELIASLR